MTIQLSSLPPLVDWLVLEKLVAPSEKNRFLELLDEAFPFRKQLTVAETIHYHIHVPDIARLPVRRFEEAGAREVNRMEGYVKFAFPGNINLIFSHIPVAQAETEHPPAENAYLDHVGIDIRREDRESYLLFQEIPLLAARNNYLFKRQGDGLNAVLCCHMQVKEKYWVFAAKGINYEMAYGPLVIQDSGRFGVDLRPANPFNQPAAEPACCEGEKTKPKSRIFVN